MSSYLDKLNLRPQERRLVVGILVVIFIVLNVLFVWPRFGDWAKVRGDLAKGQDDLFKFNKKIAQAKGPNGFESQLKKLEGEGEAVVADEQEIQLFRTVQSKVAENKVTVTDYGKVMKSTSTQNTNEFFEEQSIAITVNTGEKELVDFLLNVGSGSSMIRVRDLDLKPVDQNRYRLQGRITLSANYQKKVAAKPVAPTATKPIATTPKPTAKPATPPVTKPATPVVKPPPTTVKKT
jgi:Tfp pilus assembly protein PilO